MKNTKGEKEGGNGNKLKLVSVNVSHLNTAAHDDDNGNESRL